MGQCGNIFHVGTIENPKDFDSHAWRDKWTANCINHWAASLGQNLNMKKAIHNHLIIVLHELTHAMSGILHGNKNDTTLFPYDWDEFLDKLVSEF